ncbi:MAG: tRNA (N(6)-L-threonylcarbamoyladenosine(37)-C(2))-methylthiotransferase [Desulfurococcales archaeon]|nr:tRNA (N(6)-L-threonylcarbamoyladenosine(37)-C(2))-methylthiotransferase [Desulfurococcales archaeon]
MGKGVAGRYYIETYGCALAQFEARAMMELLEEKGYRRVPRPEEADVIVVNTCAVRLDTEQRIAERLEKLYRTLPGKRYVVAGCLAKARPGLIRRIIPEASLLSPQAVDRIVEAVRSSAPRLFLDGSRNTGWMPASLVDRDRGLIASIMIQEGCLNNCSYCITKLARGGPRSYPPRVVVDAVRRAVEQGAVEIRLTGTDTAAYGVDLPGKPTLADLVWSILDKVEGEYMLRIGMMTPEMAMELSRDLVEAYRNARVYKFFHIPVQSGDDRVLSIMGRRYTVDEFRELHASIKHHYPDSMFATDIIVGHPGEDDEAFLNTVKLVKELRFERVHLAQYSIRPHTRAAAMKQVSDGVKKQRSKILSKIVEEITLDIHRRYIGSRHSALITEIGWRRNALTARLDNYFPVVLMGGQAVLGERVTVEVRDATYFDLRGVVVG